MTQTQQDWSTETTPYQVWEASVPGNQRAWSLIKRYPVPILTLALLILSACFWLIRLPFVSHWLLFSGILLGGLPLLWDTLKHLRHREMSVDLIAMLAIIGSLLLQQYLAGTVIVLMMAGGIALEDFALRRARKSLSALANRAPRIAHAWRQEQLVNIPAEEVTIGMHIVIKPGEMAPVDGLIISGVSSVSEADLTGEPLPVRKAPGAAIFSGSVNLDGVLEVEATKRSAESKYAQIVRLVQEAQEQKAPIHRLADRYSIHFTLITLILASLAWFLSGNSVYALAVLVVATPCPLILATPIAIMSGIDTAARYSVIVKSGAVIEQLGMVNAAVFDKTGTLTLGMPHLSTLIPYANPTCPQTFPEAQLLGYAASVEQFSAHILGRAVVEAAQKQQLELALVTDFEEVFGKGVRGTILASPHDQEGLNIAPDLPVAIGNRTFMRSLHILLPEELLAEREQRTARGQIVSFLAIQNQVVGLIILEDVPRSDLAYLVPGLKQAGIRHTMLLTGDNETIARQIGQAAHVDQIVARCLPEEKVRIIKQLLKPSYKVLMVGDGINDAPALASATIGLALGTQGLTAASSAADAILLSNDILRVVLAVKLGRHVMRVARQGIWIGMGLSLVAMGFAALGYIPPFIGALLQEGIDIVVIMNALRAGKLPHTREKERAQA